MRRSMSAKLRFRSPEDFVRHMRAQIEMTVMSAATALREL